MKKGFERTGTESPLFKLNNTVEVDTPPPDRSFESGDLKQRQSVEYEPGQGGNSPVRMNRSMHNSGTLGLSRRDPYLI